LTRQLSRTGARTFGFTATGTGAFILRGFTAWTNRKRPRHRIQVKTGNSACRDAADDYAGYLFKAAEIGRITFLAYDAFNHNFPPELSILTFQY